MCKYRMILERNSDWPKTVKKTVFFILEAPSKSYIVHKILFSQLLQSSRIKCVFVPDIVPTLQEKL